jgi:hypothetical protein
LVRSELLSRFLEFLATQCSEPYCLRDDANTRAIHPLDDMWLAVLLIDHGRIVLPDHLVLVQLLEAVKIGQGGRDVRVHGGVEG